MGVARWNTWVVMDALGGVHLAGAVLVVAGIMTGVNWAAFTGAGVNTAGFVALCAYLGLRIQRYEMQWRRRDEALGHTFDRFAQVIGGVPADRDAEVICLQDAARRKSAG